jgi:hypothetical protein
VRVGNALLRGMIAFSLIRMCSGRTSGVALGDVAVAEAAVIPRRLGAVEDVLRVHLQSCDANEEARAEVAIKESVSTNDVAHVLA